MSVVTKRALTYVKALKARDAAYAEECAYWRSKGYRPHYCKHGTDQWTDYDNICGPCEDGHSNYELALMSARGDVAETRRRTDWVVTAPRDLPHDLRSKLIDWAVEPITSEVN